MTARITMDAFGNQEFPATVRRVAPYVLDLEKQARTVEIEAVLTTQTRPYCQDTVLISKSLLIALKTHSAYQPKRS